MPLARWWILHAHFNCCWIETITCQEGREPWLCRAQVLRRNTGQKGRKEQAPLKPPGTKLLWRNRTCQLVGTARLVGFASAYAAVCRVPRTHSMETKQQPHKFHHTGQLPKESCSVLPGQLVPSQGIHPFWTIIHSILSYCDQKS